MISVEAEVVVEEDGEEGMGVVVEASNFHNANNHPQNDD